MILVNVLYFYKVLKKTNTYMKILLQLHHKAGIKQMDD